MIRNRHKVNSFPELQPGDILLYGGSDLVSTLIQFRTWSDVSHIEIYIGKGRSVASRNGIGVGEYTFRADGLRRVLRPRVPFQMKRGLLWFKSVDGTPYGWGDLGKFYLLNIPTKGLICSEFGDLFFRKCDLPLFNLFYPSGAVCPRDYETISSRLVTQIWNWK